MTKTIDDILEYAQLKPFEPPVTGLDYNAFVHYAIYVANTGKKLDEGTLDPTTAFEIPKGITGNIDIKITGAAYKPCAYTGWYISDNTTAKYSLNVPLILHKRYEDN